MVLWYNGIIADSSESHRANATELRLTLSNRLVIFLKIYYLGKYSGNINV